MIILAIMQNMLVKEPERVKAMFARHPGQRNDLIKRLLFAGGLSGRRLRDTFGELCDKIIWEEANTEIFGTSNGMIAANVEHIKNAIKIHRPELIICFGKIAWLGVRRATDIRTFFAPHPAARIDDVMGKLRYTAEEVRKYLYEIENSAETKGNDEKPKSETQKAHHFCFRAATKLSRGKIRDRAASERSPLAGDAPGNKGLAGDRKQNL